jgi:hypothetical protein
LVVAAAVCETAAGAVAKRTITPSLLYAVALFSTGVFAEQMGPSLRAAGLGRTTIVLFVVVVGAIVFYVADVLNQSFAERRWRATLLEDARATFPIATVTASAAGLIVLVLPKVGAVAFVLIFVPLLAAKQEFGRFGKASRTYDETVRALASLTEGAGYVPQGHHARVAEHSVAIGREIGLSRERLRSLELVALLHDVGTVSIPDPSAMASASQQEIARRSSQIFQESGHLAHVAPILIQAAAAGPNDLVESRILRVADTFDRHAGGLDQRLSSLRSTVHPGDEDVVSAFERLTGQSLVGESRA